MVAPLLHPSTEPFKSNQQKKTPLSLCVQLIYPGGHSCWWLKRHLISENRSLIDDAGLIAYAISRQSLRWVRWPPMTLRRSFVCVACMSRIDVTAVLMAGLVLQTNPRDVWLFSAHKCNHIRWRARKRSDQACKIYILFGLMSLYWTLYIGLG